MKSIMLIRHGEADHLLDGTVGGWTDTKLTAVGRQQALHTGKRVSKVLGDGIGRVFSSDLSRAKETAELIGTTLGILPVYSAALRELNNGAAANKSKEEAKALRRPMTEPVIDWIPYPEAESWGMMHHRLSAFMESIRDDACDLTILVSHSNAIISMIHWWLETLRDMWAKVSFEIDPCSITHLSVNGFGEKTITKLNDTCHLECNH